MFVALIRTSKYAVLHFWRNFWITAITIFILTLTLLIVSLVASLNVLATQAISAVEDKVDVDLYFKQTTDESDILAAKIFLEKLPEVTNVRYISKAEALEDFTNAHQDNPTIQQALTDLDANPLPASLSIQAQELNQYELIMQQFEDSQYNDLVEDRNFTDHQVVIDRLSAFTKKVYEGGLVISAIFILVSLVMLYNTIRMAIYSHREELGIMKLVGATNWFIRAPFILEAFLYAFASSVLSMGLLTIVTFSVAPYINSFFNGYNFSVNVFFIENFWFIVLGQVIFAIVLSVGSSMLSIGRYLKV